MTEEDTQSEIDRSLPNLLLASNPTTYKIRGLLTDSDGTAVFGYNQAGSGSTRGVLGRVDSDANDAAGVRGEATNGTANAAGDGVVGITEDPGDGNQYAAGVRGEATNDVDTQTAGVYGRTSGTADGTRGVNGVADNGIGDRTYGVVGTTFGQGSDAAGVLGAAAYGAAKNYGVEGTTASAADSAAGVHGSADDTSGRTYGVHGVTRSEESGAAGVRGEATGSNGTTHGVFGTTNSLSGYGVYSQGDARVTGALDVDGPASADRLSTTNDISAGGSLSAGTHQNVGDLGFTQIRSGSPKTLSSSSQVDVPYDATERGDLGQWEINDDAYFYRVPIEGDYHVTANVQLQAEGGSAYTGSFELYLYIDDVEEAKLLSLDGPTGQISKTITANEEQKIRARIITGTSSVKLFNDRAGSFITIDKIG